MAHPVFYCGHLELGNNITEDVCIGGAKPNYQFAKAIASDDIIEDSGPLGGSETPSLSFLSDIPVADPEGFLWA